MIGITIEANRDGALAALPVEQANSVAFKKTLARGVISSLLIPHFARLDSERANDMGGRRTHFYGSTAKSLSSRVEADGVLIDINRLGFRQRLEGGVIRPGPGKRCLTIPAIAEAYGRRAGDYPLALRVGFAPDERGKMRLALIEASSTVRQTKRGYKAARKGDAKRAVYWLVPQVTQKPDPSVLPTGFQFSAAIAEVARKALSR